MELDRVGLRPIATAGAQAAQERQARYSPNQDRRRPPLTTEQRAERKARIQRFIVGRRWMPDWGGRPTEAEIAAAVKAMKTAKRRWKG